MEPISIALGLGSILSNLFGNLFGASRQSNAAKQAAEAQTRAATRAAELEYQAVTDALNYQKSIDARDYRDWLTREARDRTDWEAQELRRAPRRALADSAVRTLADYIRVPGMRPAQEIPVQRWTDPHAPVSTTMPVGPRTLADLAAPSRSVPSAAMADPGLLVKFGRRPQTLADFAR